MFCVHEALPCFCFPLSALLLFLAQPLPEAIGLSDKLKDMCLVREPVQERRHHDLSFHDHVLVTLCPFNDRALNHDLTEFCDRLNHAHLHLPAGKFLIFRVEDLPFPTLDASP